MNTNNICIFEGRLAKEPDYSTFQTGNGNVERARFSLAVDRSLSSQKRQEAEQNGQQTCDFVMMSVIGKQVDVLRNWCPVGKALKIVCHYTTWKTVDQATGQTKYGSGFEVDSIGFSVQDSQSVRNNQANNNNRNNGYQQAPQQNYQQTPPDMNYQQSQAPQQQARPQNNTNNNFSMYDDANMPF